MKKGYCFCFNHLFVLLLTMLLCVSTHAQVTKSLWVGETYMCDATSATIGSPTDISWTNSGGYISLSGSGLYRNVTATQYWSGTASVTCSWRYTLYYGGQQLRGSKTWYFTCQSNPVSISPKNMTMHVGETRYVSYSHAYSNSYTSSANVYFSCSSSCVSVTSSGQVTALKPGTAYINVYSKISADSPYCLVTVEASDPTGISISPSSRQSLAINSYIDFSYNLVPSYATGSVSWNLTGDTNAATLSSSGRLTGKAEGTVCVHVSTSNGYSDYCYVDIYKPVPSNISFNSTSQNVTLPVGANKTLGYSVSPSNAIYTVSWQSDAEDVAVVSQSGVVEAKKSGTAHITVTTDNGKSTTTTVTVPPQPASISLSPNAFELIMGRKKQLSYSMSPSIAMARTITWTSSDNSVAYVSQSGMVEARTPGSVTISATCDNGITGVCQLTIPEPLFQLFVWMKNGEKTGYLSTDKPEIRLSGENVRFSTANLSFDILKDELDKFTLEQVLPEHPTNISVAEEMKVGLGQRKRVVYTLIPVDAETTVSWFNSNPDVISVSDGGWITGLKVGTATLKAQTSNGLRAECTVEVPEPAYRFYVWLRDGDIESYAIDEKPQVKMGDEYFTLESAFITVFYPSADVLKFTLEDSAVNDPVTEVFIPKAAQPEMKYSDEKVLLSGLTPNTFVWIFDLQGKLAFTQSVSESGDCRVSLESLPTGIYIVKTEKSNYKIIKK